MFFRKIIKGYSSVFLGILTLGFIAFVCMTIGFAVTFPLWKIAVTDKGLYTGLSAAIFSLALLYFLSKRIIKAYKESPRRLLISFLKKIIVIGGLFLFVYAVLSFKKVLAAAVLIAIVSLYGFTAFVLPQSKNKPE